MVTYTDPKTNDVLAILDNELYGVEIIVSNPDEPVSDENVGVRYYKKRHVPIELLFIKKDPADDSLYCTVSTNNHIFFMSQDAVDDFAMTLRYAVEMADAVNEIISEILQNSWTNNHITQRGE